MFRLFRKRKDYASMEFTVEDKILLYEGRDFLRSLITENTHRVRICHKRIDLGSMYFEIRNKIHFEISAYRSTKIMAFSFYNPDYEVETNIHRKDSQVNINPYVDNLLTEIKDLLKLCWYIDQINSNMFHLFIERKNDYLNLIKQMDWDYGYDYKHFSQRSLLKLSKRKDQILYEQNG